MDDQRDYAEEAYNRQQAEYEAKEENAAEWQERHENDIPLQTERFIAYRKISDGSIHDVRNGDAVRNLRNKEGFFIKVTHPRKVYVEMQDGQKVERYASVFNLGIWDAHEQRWTFRPDWANPSDK